MSLEKVEKGLGCRIGVDERNGEINRGKCKTLDDDMDIETKEQKNPQREA